MSEASRRSRVTISLGRSGQVVNRAGSELDEEEEYELPRAGNKRSVKERLGKQLDSSFYGGDVVSKRQRGEASFSGNDLQVSKNDLRFKLMQKNAKRRAQSEECITMDLREKLSRSEQPPRSLDARPRMVEPRDGPFPTSRSSYSPWALDDIRQRSPERFVGTSRGISPPRNAGSIIGISRDLSPPRNSGRIMGTRRSLSPPRNAGSIIGAQRHLSPPRTSGRIIGTLRDLSPPRNTRRFSGGSRALSPTRNVESYMGSSHRFSPPRNTGSYMGSSRGSPPPRNIDDFHGRSRMFNDVRVSRYTVSGVLNSQAPRSNASFPRPMLPPPVPNPHPLPPLSQLPPLGSIMQNSPFHVEEPLTVDSFLNSLGLGKYSLAFKREEVDMNTIKQMKETDLKDLIIPMGPRKKILQAIASLPKS